MRPRDGSGVAGKALRLLSLACVRLMAEGSVDNVLRVKGMECNVMGANELID
jgi:hypothetical protein